jgi:hypothetical protein
MTDLKFYDIEGNETPLETLVMTRQLLAPAESAPAPTVADDAFTSEAIAQAKRDCERFEAGFQAGYERRLRHEADMGLLCGHLIRDGQTTIGACQLAPGHDGEHQRLPMSTADVHVVTQAFAAAEARGAASAIGRAGETGQAVSDSEMLVALFSLRAVLHRGSESGEYFFSVFGKPVSPKTFKTILEAARHACGVLEMLPPNPPPADPKEQP